MVGESRAMQEVLRLLRLAGPRRCTVLIGGESGTGKELAAKALHGLSERRKFPMVAVNCSAIPENLLESELFGHVKGAFTGAMTARAGRFEQAHKGTLFLDEIADMPLDLQAKLLRVLQEREFQRLGSSETIRVDVRIIAASNVNLLDRVSEGRFREDLYYRLNVMPIRMPALRERLSDIPLLARHFLDKSLRQRGPPPPNAGARRSGAALRLLLAGKYPAIGERHRDGGGDERRPANASTVGLRGGVSREVRPGRCSEPRSPGGIRCILGD